MFEYLLCFLQTLRAGLFCPIVITRYEDKPALENRKVAVMLRVSLASDTWSKRFTFSLYIYNIPPDHTWYIKEHLCNGMTFLSFTYVTHNLWKHNSLLDMKSKASLLIIQWPMEQALH